MRLKAIHIINFIHAYTTFYQNIMTINLVSLWLYSQNITFEFNAWH